VSDAAKRGAAKAAVDLLREGMLVGLGTGSTMEFVVREIAVRGLRITGLPTSLRTEALALELGVALTDFSHTTHLDIAIDGADEIEPGSLALIKGLGGALLRERIVATAARRFVVVADRGKLVARLGSHAPVPVEVVPFGHQSTARRLAALGGAPVLRLVEAGPFLSDNGNLIYDCPGFGPIGDPVLLDRMLTTTVGVVAHGLFLHMADAALIGDDSGAVESFTRR
jgi:ribose 5-phosphate isomerase A